MWVSVAITWDFASKSVVFQVLYSWLSTKKSINHNHLKQTLNITHIINLVIIKVHMMSKPHADRFVSILFVWTDRQSLCKCAICKYITPSTNKKEKK